MFYQLFSVGWLLGTSFSTSLFRVSSAGEKRFEVPGSERNILRIHRERHIESNKKTQSFVTLELFIKVHDSFLHHFS